jgi:signal transduction histidine kinase
MHQLLVQSGIALTVMTVASGGLGWLVAGRVLRPLRTMTTTVRDISATNLHRRLAVTGPRDELSDLGDTFDNLLGRLEKSFTAQRQFVANASHELRTPLTRQRTLAQVAIAAPDATMDTLRAAHEHVIAFGRQQEQLIDALLTLARGQAGPDRYQHIDLADLSRDMLPARQELAEHHGLCIDSQLLPARTDGDPRLIERLITNLVDNALRHNVDHGWVRITTDTRNGRAVLTVANSGPVIPQAQLGQLVQPFQRLGADRTSHADGHGLGLSIVDAVVATHDATLGIHARPRGGLDIEVGFRATLSQPPSP